MSSLSLMHRQVNHQGNQVKIHPRNRQGSPAASHHLNRQGSPQEGQVHNHPGSQARSPADSLLSSLLCNHHGSQVRIRALSPADSLLVSPPRGQARSPRRSLVFNQVFNLHDSLQVSQAVNLPVIQLLCPLLRIFQQFVKVGGMRTRHRTVIAEPKTRKTGKLPRWSAPHTKGGWLLLLMLDRTLSSTTHLLFPIFMCGLA